MPNMLNGVAVLLVDDDPLDTRILKRALAESGAECRIYEAHRGSDALEWVRARKEEGEGAARALILLDLKMPGMDGFDVLRELRSEELSTSIPAVVVTSSALQTDIDRSYQLGAVGYLIKPFDYRELIGAMRKLGEYWETCEMPTAP